MRTVPRLLTFVVSHLVMWLTPRAQPCNRATRWHADALSRSTFQSPTLKIFTASYHPSQMSPQPVHQPATLLLVIVRSTSGRRDLGSWI
jgi:hypothetical protein